jgi:hypothetical protein
MQLLGYEPTELALVALVEQMGAAVRPLGGVVEFETLP